MMLRILKTQSLTILLAVLGLAPSLWAQVWTVTTADFKQQDGQLVGASPEKVQLRQANVVEIPCREVVSLELREREAQNSADPFVLFTRDGQRLKGTPQKIIGEKLLWGGSVFKALELPLEEIRGWARADSLAIEDPGTEDIAILQNGDRLQGIIEGDDQGLAIVRGSDRTALKWDAIRSVTLAKIGNASTQPASAALRIRLADGSICLAQSARTDGSDLHLSRGRGAELVVPVAMVFAIDNVAGRAIPLASIAPTRYDYVPYATTVQPSRAARLDEVEIRGSRYRDVLQIRPQTTLAYQSPITGNLHLRVACGNAGQYTNMSLAVFIDDTKTREIPAITAHQETPALDVPVRAGQQIRLELGYGKHFDVQDFLCLIEAAFVAQ